jgi:hypothetical protein
VNCLTYHANLMPEANRIASMHRRACVPISLSGGHNGLLAKMKALAKIINDAVIIGAIG